MRRDGREVPAGEHLVARVPIPVPERQLDQARAHIGARGDRSARAGFHSASPGFEAEMDAGRRNGMIVRPVGARVSKGSQCTRRITVFARSLSR